MGVIAKPTGGGGSPGAVGPGGLATGKLLGVTDELVFNFVVNIDFGCMGVLLSGAFLGGQVNFHGGIGLGTSNPVLVVTDPADGTHGSYRTTLPGLYFTFILTDTMRFALVSGNASTDIDVTVFAPHEGYYHSAYDGLVS